MKKPKNEKRVINVPKSDFDLIKKHCEENSLDMVSWMVKNTTEKLAKEIPKEIITAEKAREIHLSSLNVIVPKDWLEWILNDINESVKEAIISGQTETHILWGATMLMNNQYGVKCRVPLSYDHILIVEKELHGLGFVLTKIDQDPRHIMYSVGW